MLPAKNGTGTTLALKITLGVLGTVLVFGGGLVADDLIVLRSWVWGHRSATAVHAVEYKTLRQDVDVHMEAQKETMALLKRIAEKLEVE